MQEHKLGLMQIHCFAPPVVAFQTTRHGGSSSGAYASFNLGPNSGDDAATVAHNRLRLALLLDTPQVKFMQQEHGCKVVTITDASQDPGVCDGMVTALNNVALCVQTADCLPLLLADDAGTAIGAVHCGWRSLSGGIIAPALTALRALGAEHICAWMGPAIGPQSFEVGPEVKAAFVKLDPLAAKCFVPGQGDRLLADLYALTRLQLEAAGVQEISAACFDTFTESELFYSYRRDGVTGRMASVIVKRAA